MTECRPIDVRDPAAPVRVVVNDGVGQEFAGSPLIIFVIRGQEEVKAVAQFDPLLF